MTTWKIDPNAPKVEQVYLSRNVDSRFWVDLTGQLNNQIFSYSGRIQLIKQDSHYDIYSINPNTER